MTTIGVIIVSFNTRDLLRECLASLQACSLPLRIVVVDNGSRDNSTSMVRAEFPNVAVIEPQQNLGFAAANNRGLRVLEYRAETPIPQHPNTPTHILFLNPDTVVHAGAIEALVAFLEDHPRVGVVGPRLLNVDGTVQAAAFRFPTLLMAALDLFPPGVVLPGRLYNSWWHGRYPQEQVGAAPFPIDHPLGACMLVRQEALAEVGGFDTDFFMYAEEVEWCYRIRQAGWAIWQVPSARVTHVGGASTSQFRTAMTVALWENRLKFFRKHDSSNFVRWHKTLVRFGMLRAVLLAWRDWAQGTLDTDGLRARLWAFGRVFGM